MASLSIAESSPFQSVVTQALATALHSEDMWHDCMRRASPSRRGRPCPPWPSAGAAGAWRAGSAGAPPAAATAAAATPQGRPPLDTCGLHPPFSIYCQWQHDMRCHLLRAGPHCSSEGRFVTIELLPSGTRRRATLRTCHVICALHGLSSLATISSGVKITCIAWRSCPISKL